MRVFIGPSAVLAIAAFAAGASAMPLAPIPGHIPTRVEYFCSPGFAPQGGRCVATASRDEIELFEIDPYDDPPPPVRHRHRRQGLRKLY